MKKTLTDQITRELIMKYGKNQSNESGFRHERMVKMKETLTEAIAKNLVEKKEPFAVARELVDGKIKLMIPYLKSTTTINSIAPIPTMISI